ncbi:MAG TPA: ROK family transcriptional regulator [Trueperaceae bacterium]|nr:ROK family transcriptional regulator [Trueperaceae bacterium]
MRRPSSRALGRERIRSLNQSAVISAIHSNGRISRTELAAELRLSPAAITALTAPFVEDGLVFEAEIGTSPSVGRKPILLAINYDHAHVYGVKVMNHAVVAALTNLNAEVVAVRTQALPDTKVRTVVDAVVSATTALRKSAAGAAVRPLGVGVSLPGVVDHLAGSVRHSQLFGWGKVPFADMLSEELRLPVLVENDVNALAAAHGWFGHGRGHEAFLVLTLGRGVGLGIVTSGAVYRGPRGGAGEFGHTVCAPIAPRVMEPGHTTLEQRLGDAGLIAQARRLTGRDLDADAITSLAAEGDEAILDLLADSGDCLGVAMSDLINIFAPTLIILGGEGLRNAPYFLPRLRPMLERHTFGDLAEDVEIVTDSWGDDGWARGAAGLAAARFLQEASIPLDAASVGMGSA